MDDLAAPFEEARAHLRGVAFRMLGSLSEAEDAVQEAWIRLQRADTSDVANLRGWLTTVVSRVCLDMLRTRKSRREEPMGPQVPEPVAAGAEQEAALADSVGLALMVVLDTLAPAERLAFVLHDLFAVPFEEIATIVGRSPDAARQLASRARRRVRVGDATDVDITPRRELVGRFLTALRAGDLEGLIAVLDPDVVVRADAAVTRGAPAVSRGAREWAKGAVAFGRMAQGVQLGLVDGEPALVIAPGGRPVRVICFTIEGAQIASVEIIADPATLAGLEISVD
jgi:RNA polymerase sigma-70 factor (ECF subfamily)